MGERKVQAKYYPPDFDPSKVPRISKKRQTDNAVRFMLPMSVRCETCGDFMGTGTKFNARKSDANEDYLGVRIFRFSMKCKSCPATFTIKTDPKNGDYICESGVKRNYEPWRDKNAKEEELKKERDRQDEDTIQALENKTADAKKQMEDLDELQEIRLINVRRAEQNIDSIFQREDLGRKRKREQEEQSLLVEAKRAFETKRRPSNFNGPTETIRQQQNDEKEKLGRIVSPSIFGNAVGTVNTSWGKIKLKKKTQVPKEKEQQSTDQNQTIDNLVEYPSSSSDEE